MSLFRDVRGVATIEFALASLFLFATISVALDFGFNIQQKLKLGHAVEQAAILAYNQQTGSDTSTITNFVKAAAGTRNTPTVTITCNGTSTCGDGHCGCINSTTGALVLAAACNATCAGSSAISGNYMKIAASATYNAVIVPNQYLNGGTMTSSAVVRLQ